MIPPCNNCGQEKCHFCHLARTDPRYARLYSVSDLPFAANSCIFRGAETGRRNCPACAGKVEVKTFACLKHGNCSIEKDVGVKTCASCQEKTQFNLHQAYDWKDLGAAVPGSQRKFNSSLLRYNGDLILATRIHEMDGWSPGRIFVEILDDNFQQRGKVVELKADHHKASLGIEDPRLFVHSGRLHVGFSGVEPAGDGIVSNQFYARLAADLSIDELFCLEYPGRQSWEKNWGFFSHDNQLYAVYQIAGHEILAIDGSKARPAYRSATAWPGSIGLPRGGSSPVRRGNEFYSFFHDVREENGLRHYGLCLYTFEASPPFRINRIAKAPLFFPDPAHRPDDNWTPNVVFPCGAFLEDNLWHVSAGYMDRWSMLFRFDINQTEKLLQIAPGSRDSSLALRDFRDWDIWQGVYNQNEYELPERIDGWTVVDVGGHIGSFAKLCLDRGADHVISIEPHPDHQGLFRKNLAGHEAKYTLVCAAAYGRAIKQEVSLVGYGCIANVVGFDCLPGESPSEERRNVPTVELGKVECDLLKLDCEGAEYEILENADLSGVKRIFGEGHLFGGLPGMDWLRHTLEDKGFQVRIEKTGPMTCLFWAERL